MLAQHTDEPFRADHVRFRNAGGAACKCSCEVTFSQPKHSFVIMVATPFWNSGTSGTPEAIWSTTNVDLPRPSVRCAPPPFSDRRAPESAFDSTFWRKNDTEQHSFVPAYLPGSADMRTTIRRDHPLHSSTLRRFKAVGRWNSMHITFRRCAGLVTRR